MPNLPAARSKPRAPIPQAAFAAAAVLAAAGLALISPAEAFAEDGPKGETLVYTASGATTAVLPLLWALEKGWPGSPAAVEEWKSLDDLRSLVLAGKGDVWVGHLEAFGRAASKGARVTLLAVTAWRKFYFVSGPVQGPAGKEAAYPAGPSELAGLLAGKGLSLYAAPQSSPASGILAKIASLGGPSFDVKALPLQQVLLELASGRATAALVPEPGVSAALARNPSLRVVGSLEDEYAAIAGGQARLPHAGVAADPAFIGANPERAESLVSLMLEGAESLAAMPPEEAARRLPAPLREGLGEKTLADSLSRDPILAVRASEVEKEVETFLCLAAPEICRRGAPAPPFPADFVYRGKPAAPRQ
ncbi:MAG: hypothetical protein LBW85_03200 [Deltaproteobacteria bacterium]|jgi:NitT/TauT family transport system substrate-binding protein|nr:hypothetical protein [Deltaproteobacteria bacterium]